MTSALPSVAPMDASLLDLLARCGIPSAPRGALLGGMFAAGLAGSALHCAPMCGAFVLGQVSDRMARLPASQFCEWRRLSAGALLPYHAGRIVTYAALGAAAGLSGDVLARAPLLRGSSAALLALAACVLLLQGFGVGGAWSRGLGQAARRIGAGGFGLGLVLGLLPCGMIYGALLAAAGSGDPVIGGAAMAAFGLGTMPALILVGIAGQAAGHRFRAGMRAARPALIGGSALLLLGLAVAEARGF